ncbi:hypothetical protein NC651_035975 [Populus alba x Populus x berolinensis]|nr:hypothetical protein NC651_035975 [Populus alba x Populus x berolinensis]
MDVGWYFSEVFQETGDREDWPSHRSL